MADPHFSSEELYAGRGWRITRDKATLPDGRVKTVERGHRPDSVHVLAFSDENRILMIREFRPFYQKYIWMLPSGKVDKETDPDVAAQRELREETGFRADSIRRYCIARHTDVLTSRNFIYIARELHQDPLPQDTNELIEVHKLPFKDALAHVLDDEFAHTPTAYALLRYAYENSV